MRMELKNMVGPEETILYEGKPDKKTFIFEGVFNPLLPIALLWLIFDGAILLSLTKIPFVEQGRTFFLVFFLFHMMPVWIYLVGIIFVFRKYRNANYIVTDRAVYISKGIFRMDYLVKSFAEMSYVNLHRGIFDQWFHVGDVRITTNQTNNNGLAMVLKMDSIADYEKVYHLVKKLQQDIYSDIQFPNDLRPGENPGYHTKYKG